MQCIGHDDIFALGDCAAIENQENPATAQVAMQQSGIVAANICKITRGGKSRNQLKKFKFLNLGEMLTLGVTHASITR